MKTNCFAISFFAVLLSAGSAMAGDSVVSGPVLGFVVANQSKSLSTILGIPGASTMGADIPFPDGVSGVFVSPGQDYAIASAGDDAHAVLLDLRSIPVQTSGIAGGLANANITAFSPSGKAVAIYSTSGGRIQVLAGFPDNFGVSRSIALATGVSAIAVSDDGSALVAVSGGTVSLVGGDGTLTPLASGSLTTSLAFAPGSHDLVVGDPDAGSVSVIRDVTRNATPGVLASAADGLAAPLAVAASTDGASVFIATSSGVAVVPANGGVVSTVTCGCSVGGLFPMRGASVFRLTDSSGGPIWLFDGGGEQPRIVFVPQAQQTDSVTTDGGAR